MQTRDYIKVSSESYIHRLLKTHGWDTPVDDTSAPREPLPPDSYIALYNTDGPPEGSQEAASLAAEFGYTYRGLLGELMFPYVTSRVDIGLAINVLSKFSTAPARIHYTSLKRVAKYLRRTADWGLLYWRLPQTLLCPMSLLIPSRLIFTLLIFLPIPPTLDFLIFSPSLMPLTPTTYATNAQPLVILSSWRALPLLTV